MDIVTEADFRKHMTGLAKILGGHVSNIESHLTSAGIPDMNVWIDGVELWLELKMYGPKCHLRPTQRKWHKERKAAGGRSWVLVYVPGEESIVAIPGYVAAEAADLRQLVRDGSYDPVNIDMTSSLLFRLIQLEKERGGKLRTHAQHKGQSKYTTKSGPNRDGEAPNPGGAGPTLPPSGEDVERDHWLLNKP